MLGRNIQSDQDSNVEINLSPMIDCIFILLIFFIVTTVFVEETGVEVNKPDIKGASMLDKNSILLAITEDNGVVYGGEVIGVQGVATVVKQALREDPEMPVIIQGDTHADHGMVMQVHGEAKTAGATLITVSSKN
ncbi:MAG TPA: biopolymer transporter ExbD [Verrucomicrobiales bacterium]|nr:biopolymer transporter ExbD [Verrucomicrobiales bacterium]